MAKSQRKASPPTTLEILGGRIKAVINSPRAQLARQIVITKAADEAQEDWDEIVEAISDTEGVTVLRQEHGGVHIAWEASPDY
ncbi:MAG TPA: DUF1654 domain-containing protein [Pseudomonas sp.]|jgi:hypothetical protein